MTFWKILYINSCEALQHCRLKYQDVYENRKLEILFLKSKEGEKQTSVPELELLTMWDDVVIRFEVKYRCY